MGQNLKSTAIIIYSLIIAVWFLYLYTMLADPLSPTSMRLGLTENSISIIRVTVALPYLVIWLVAAWAAFQLKSYSVLVGGLPAQAGETRKRAFALIGLGVFWLMLEIITPLLASSARRLLDTESFNMLLTIISNVFRVFFSLVGFWFIYRGVQKITMEGPREKKESLWFTLFFLFLISLFFTWLVFTNPIRNVSPELGLRSTYYLPDPLILLTIIAPLVIAWGLGIRSAFMLNRLALAIENPYFLKANWFLTQGLWWIIFASILLQALLAVGTPRLIDLGLALILLLIYGFLIIQGIGFFFITRSVKYFLKFEKKI